MATQETIKQMFSGGTLRDVEDVTARQAIAQLQSALDTMTDEDTTTAIETFQEVIDFLSGVTDDETLIGKLNELRSLINAKYTKPSGGIPASDIASGVIPDVSGKANKSEMSITPGTGADADKTNIQLKDGTTATVLTAHQSLTGKQDTIDDLGLIRTNSQKGIASVSASDGNVVITLVNGDIYTITLSHIHTQYLKYELLENEAAYTTLANNNEINEDTLYLIPETTSTT